MLSSWNNSNYKLKTLQKQFTPFKRDLLWQCKPLAYFSLVTDVPPKYYSVHGYLRKRNKNSGSAVIKPVGEVLLPRISGILSSSLCKHQQIRNQHNCRPRILREQYPCGFSHRLLQCDVDGVSPFCRHFHVPCRLHRQWHLVLNTLHR